MTTRPDGRRNVAILVWQDAELLDFAGPGEVFAAADDGRAFRVYTVGLTRDPIVSQGFVTIQPEHTLDDAPAADIIVLPGGGTEAPAHDERLLAWLRDAATRADSSRVTDSRLGGPTGRG